MFVVSRLMDFFFVRKFLSVCRSCEQNERGMRGAESREEENIVIIKQNEKLASLE